MFILYTSNLTAWNKQNATNYTKWERCHQTPSMYKYDLS